MAFFRRLLDAIKTDRTPYQPALSEFPNVDPAKLRRELKIDERAKARGKTNEPPATQAGFDEVEQEIITQFEQFRQQGQSCLANNLQVYAGRLARADNEALVDAVEREFDEAMTDFKAGVITDSNRLYIAKRNVLEVEDEYRAFRRNHKLERVARYPSHWFKNVSIVLLFALADTIANAVFFSVTHPRGWAGAIFESVFISVVNTVVGFGGGYFLARGSHHPQPAVKGMSALSLVVLIAFLLAFNIFAAHYRDAFGALTPEVIAEGRDAASNEAFKRLQAQLWVLAGFQSYLMVVIGMIVAVVALIEGYRLDDAFPGFGAVARHREKLLTGYAAEKEMLLAGLKERRDDALRAIDYLVDAIKRRDEEFATIMESRRGLVARCNMLLTHLQSVASQLIETYRSGNRTARTEAAPPSFGQSWKPDWPPEAAPSGTAEPGRNLVGGRLVARLKEARRAFLSAYDDAVLQYQRIDHIVSKEALDNARPAIG